MKSKAVNLGELGFRGTVEFSQDKIFGSNKVLSNEVCISAGRGWSKKEMNAFYRAYNNGDRITLKWQMPWREQYFTASGYVESLECGDDIDGSIALGHAEFQQAVSS